MKTPGVFTTNGSFTDNAAAQAVFTSDNSGNSGCDTGLGFCGLWLPLAAVFALKRR
ncbi:MAG: hypothetical protein IJU98_07500 [Synergistaceae bacterium]|nr:hypothetical protein [Synergistaceae bacterium]